MSRSSKAAAGAVALVLALVVASCGDDDDDTAATTSADVATEGAPSTTAASTTTAAAGVRIERTVSGGALEGEPGREPVAVGEEVTIVVEADVQEEVHIHGYDLFADVAPGQPAELTFPADIPGVFEVELEGAGLLLVELEVS